MEGDKGSEHAFEMSKQIMNENDQTFPWKNTRILQYLGYNPEHEI